MTGYPSTLAMAVNSTASMRGAPFSSLEIMLRSKPTRLARSCWDSPMEARLSRTRSPIPSQLNWSIMCAITAQFFLKMSTPSFPKMRNSLGVLKTRSLLSSALPLSDHPFTDAGTRKVTATGNQRARRSA